MTYKLKSTPYSQTHYATYMRNYKRNTENGRKQVKNMQNQNKQYRIDLIELLGRQCKRCSYKEDIRALQIDHINGGGHGEQRKFISSYLMYKHYLTNPKEAFIKLQILCANCNAIKRHENDEFAHTRWKEV